MIDELAEYRRRRTLEPTPTPTPTRSGAGGGRFVVHELRVPQPHWNLRLEHEGVLASWTVPRGVPRAPGEVRLAVRIDHRPPGYTDGEVWDQGGYQARHWNDHRVEVVLDGARLRGRYALVHRHDPAAENAWKLTRLDPAEPGHEATPGFLPPMPARPGPLPPSGSDGDWAYEFRWSGLRVILRVAGGRVTAFDETGEDVTASYPELKGLGAQLGSTEVVLDGEIVVFADGRPDPDGLRRRVAAGPAEARRLVHRHPAFFLAADVLHLDFRSRLAAPHHERRALLDGLALAGPHWQVPPSHPGDGAAVARAARDHGLAGLTAKRRDSPYRPGTPNDDWIEVCPGAD
ncbi:DNA polymerase ligase N-terminal domain-containing protein [Amycolatopsis sp. PS_44_ISF1]|uniref:DNA polymerase ligase N-terminal domain-containing protein n=1 Tax=Amycolatopsis sp. PS_44_ISF1 TaxID=2974917 RepID=UPI0028DF9A6B|nr:DNA polymerase ligase N-terminal domain-containing protein [Amycolatopsis sp. PS_44_ISF1]MDT8912473.1 ATP-dependent DNA ligase [Amycolatopsis sp. PS_44_ISF1]